MALESLWLGVHAQTVPKQPCDENMRLLQFQAHAHRSSMAARERGTLHPIMTAGDETPRRGLELSDRQLQVWRALRAKSRTGYAFHDWYVGALSVLRSSNDDNPDRLAQAANSLRELLE